MESHIDWSQLSEEAREDRRQGKRVTLGYGLEVRGADEHGAFYVCAARTRNVSEHGCCFETATKIRSGEVVSLQVVRHEPNGEKQSTKALIFRVCWVTKEDGLWVAGAEMAEEEKPWGIAFPKKVRH
ncbi:MAG TPA: PilZ domain-containing protein [Candidatus Acidoferrales bacterium]|jgi:hypothetical protein|nr:PilZ domain-containing protein [Candidatus Acidoferrales bacterium]